jgi:hypothetical protein
MRPFSPSPYCIWNFTSPTDNFSAWPGAHNADRRQLFHPMP